MAKNILSMLLLVTLGSANYTTTFWQPRWDQIDKVGYIGSVSTAGAGVATLEIGLDDGVAEEIKTKGYIRSYGNVTIGPQTMGWDSYPELGPNGCTKEHVNKNTVVCSTTYRGDIVSLFSCRQGTQRTANVTEIETFTHTYPGRLSYSSGVETVTTTAILLADQSSVPDWCNDPEFTPEPSALTWTLSDEEIQTVQLIITAGVEKLNATATTSGSVNPTASVSQTSSLPQETNAAAQLGLGAPVMMSLGAAIAAFVL